MPQIGIVEHIGCPDSKEDGKDCNNVGMDSQLVPEQCKNESDGTCKVHVQPFFCIIRLKRCLQHLFKCTHIFLLFHLLAVVTAVTISPLFLWRKEKRQKKHPPTPIPSLYGGAQPLLLVARSFIMVSSPHQRGGLLLFRLTPEPLRQSP